MDLYGVSAPLDDINDPLSGILIMGNMMKRIGQEKLFYAQTLDRRIREYDEAIRHKNDLMEQMEIMIRKLQEENAHADGHFQEEKVRHSHRVTILSKEIQTIREDFNMLKGENDQLKEKLLNQEKALMNIPRLEEQYMRNARSAVRQSEVANTLNRIEFKKMEDELKNLTFWKNKAKSMEETIHKQRQDIEILEQQHRTTFSKYQNLMRTTRQLNETMVGGTGTGTGSAAMAHQTAPTLSTTTAATLTRSDSQASNIAGPSSSSSRKGARRPSSAPSARRSASHKSLGIKQVVDADMIVESSGASIADTKVQHASVCSSSPSYDQSSSGQGKNAAVAADEIMRLRAELKQKDRHIVQLSQRLCFARAHPLLSTTETAGRRGDDGKRRRHASGGGGEHSHSDSDSTDDADREEDISRKKKLTNSLMRRSNPLIGEELQNLPYMQDAFDESSLVRAEEDALQEEREHRAMELQLRFSAQQHERKMTGPPHIVAIRQARNFGKAIDEVVQERDRAFLQQKLATSHRDIAAAKS
jgi:hypothetical protein